MLLRGDKTGKPCYGKRHFTLTYALLSPYVNSCYFVCVFFPNPTKQVSFSSLCQLSSSNQLPTTMSHQQQNMVSGNCASPDHQILIEEGAPAIISPFRHRPRGVQLKKVLQRAFSRGFRAMMSNRFLSLGIVLLLLAFIALLAFSWRFQTIEQDFKSPAATKPTTEASTSVTTAALDRFPLGQQTTSAPTTTSGGNTTAENDEELMALPDHYCTFRKSSPQGGEKSSCLLSNSSRLVMLSKSFDTSGLRKAISDSDKDRGLTPATVLCLDSSELVLVELKRRLERSLNAIDAGVSLVDSYAETLPIALGEVEEEEKEMNMTHPEEVFNPILDSLNGTVFDWEWEEALLVSPNRVVVQGHNGSELFQEYAAQKAALLTIRTQLMERWSYYHHKLGLSWYYARQERLAYCKAGKAGKRVLADWQCACRMLDLEPFITETEYRTDLF